MWTVPTAYYQNPPTTQTTNSFWTWGKNNYGQLGINATTSRSSPIQVLGSGASWQTVAGAVYNSAAIKTDGTLWLWGRNYFGELGDNTRVHRSSPVQTIVGGNNWIQISSAGQSHGAIKNDGTFWVWGRNDSGQLATNNTTWYSSPVQTVAGGTAWKQVSIGGSFGAAIKNDGTLWTWGDNSIGSLATNNLTNRSSPVQTVTGGSDWKFVTTMFLGIAAIKTDGTLWLWGGNNVGQLGDNTVASRSSPVQTVTGGTNWWTVNSSNITTAAIKTDGTLWTWGSNYYGQLGDNTGPSIKRSSPVQTVAGGTDWRAAVIGGDGHTTTLKSDGTIWTWGNNDNGQLGDGTRTKRSSPIQTIAGGTNWRAVMSGTYHAGGLKDPKYMWLSGKNTYGQLGDNTIIHKSSPVQTIAGGSFWESISIAKYGGGSSSLSGGIKLDNSLWLWGTNQFGEIGDNTTTKKSSPVQTIAGGNNWRNFAAGSLHCVAIKNDGTLWVWGRNQYGQLGDNTTVDKSSPTQTVTGGTVWRSVAAGNRLTAAIKEDGSLWMWGHNYSGQVGDNTRTNRSSPVQTITGGNDWRQVAVEESGAAIKTDGTLWTWGSGTSLGTGDGNNRSSPVQTIAGGTNWAQIAVGLTHMAAIKTDGSLWTWGANGIGQLGDNTPTNRLSPVQTIAGGTTWSLVAVGYGITAAIKQNGSLWTWGNNTYGGLADNTTTNRSSPVQTIASGTIWRSVVAGNTGICMLGQV